MPKKKPQQKSNWKNRIVGHGEQTASEFALNPLNPKKHPEIQQKAVAAILQEIGWVTGVIVNVRTGLLVDGESRVSEALKKDPNEIIPFIQVDVSEDEEKKLLALFDKIGALALTDDTKLQELLDMIEIESDVLQSILQDAEAEDIDLDDFFEPEMEIESDSWELKIEFDSEEEYNAVLSSLKTVDKSPKAALKQLLQL